MITSLLCHRCCCFRLQLRHTVSGREVGAQAEYLHHHHVPAVHLSGGPLLGGFLDRQAGHSRPGVSLHHHNPGRDHSHHWNRQPVSTNNVPVVLNCQIQSRDRTDPTMDGIGAQAGGSEFESHPTQTFLKTFYVI